jgi:proline iminopeptidase
VNTKRVAWCFLFLVGLSACAADSDQEEDGSGSALIPHPFSISAGPDVDIGGMQVGMGNPPLIVLHGGPGMDHRYLRPSLDALADEHWVIYLDQRGSGFSETEVTSDLINFDALVADIDRVREWTGAQRVDILGHSWGTVLAMHYALRNPRAVRRMVLVSPAEPGVRYRQDAEDRRASRVDPADRMLLAEIASSEAFKKGDASAISQYYTVVFKPLLFDPGRPVSISLHPRTARNGFAVMAALADGMPDPDYWKQLGSITSPTLIVHGAADAYPIEMVEEMASALARGTLLVLEEAGHFGYIETPEAFFDGVRSFLGTGAGS